jgi:hypothetical protein
LRLFYKGWHWFLSILLEALAPMPGACCSALAGSKEKEGVAGVNALFKGQGWCFNEIARGISSWSDRGCAAPLGVTALTQEAIWMQ